MTAKKNWLITGAGRGFGRQFAEAAMTRGDKVAATVRDLAVLADLQDRYGDLLVPLKLDVTDREAVAAAVAEARDRMGRIDVVVNNAGYGLFGMVEELSEEELRRQFDVNFFGAFHVVQAVLPVLREQGSGHIVQISSVGGVVAFPNLGGYNASKWALEGLSEALAGEVAAFGIKVTIIEPAGYSTDWSGASAVFASQLSVYNSVREQVAAGWAEQPDEWVGTPEATGPAMLEVVDSEEPPLRVFFGTAPTVIVPQAYAQKLEEWKKWEDLSRAANG